MNHGKTKNPKKSEEKWQMTHDYEKKVQQNIVTRFEGKGKKDDFSKKKMIRSSLELLRARKMSSKEVLERKQFILDKERETDEITMEDSHITDDIPLPVQEICPSETKYDDWGKSTDKETNDKVAKSYRTRRKKYIKDLSVIPTRRSITILDKLRKVPSTSGPKRSIIKIETHRTALIATPYYIQFRNFKLDTTYKRTVILKNNSTYAAKFQLEPWHVRSAFTVMIETFSKRGNVIPPGLHAKLIIFFRSNDVHDVKETLVINVQYGRQVYVTLHGCRDAPVLRVVNPDPEVGRVSALYMSMRGESITSLNPPEAIPLAIVSQQTLTSTDTSDDASLIRKEILSSTLDCGKCFVSEIVNMSIILKNVGGEARFFIMTEIDWCSMHIEDVTNTNMLLLPCFSLHPAYFKLKSQEIMRLEIYFFPDSYGIHIDKLYIASDNFSFLQMEIMGDAVMFELNFFEFSEHLIKLPPPCKDMKQCFCYKVDMDAEVHDEILSYTFFVINDSEVSIHYRWEKREACADIDNDNDTGGEMEHRNSIPLECLELEPERGTFPPSSKIYFHLNVATPDLYYGRYVIILQFYVEDIPLAAIPKNAQFHMESSTHRRRSTVTSMDIRVAEIEVVVNLVDERPCACVPPEVPEWEDFEIVDWPEFDWEADAFDQPTLYSEDYQTKPELAKEELFSSFDVIHTESIRRFVSGEIVNAGCLHVTRPMFIGYKETYEFFIKNISTQLLSFTWGEPIGKDADKLKICMCPNQGNIQAGFAQRMNIEFLPVEEGDVCFLRVPCYINNSQKVIMLDIECTIETFYVTFHIPLLTETSVPDKMTHVEWHVDSSKEPVSLSARLIDHEERELKNIDLDQGITTKDVGVGPSTTSLGEGIEDFNFTGEYRSIGGESWDALYHDILKTKDEIGEIIPFHKTVLPRITRSVVIEFLKLPLLKVVKRTIIIRNETPIISSVWIMIKNFYPVYPFRKRELKIDIIKSIYKKVFNCKDDEIWDRIKQPQSGILIYVEPIVSWLYPYSAVPVDIYVYADTWGIYTDELEINVSGLPQYTLGICVQVTELPISFPISEKIMTKTPIFRFGAIPAGSTQESRKILIKNHSILPLIIDWYTFLPKPNVSEDELPFQILLRAFTPFTDELAKTFNKPKQCSIDKLLEKSVATEIRDDVIDDFDIISDKTSSQCSGSYGSKCCQSFDVYPESDFFEETIPSNVENVTKETDFDISFLPFPGVINPRCITICPAEVFIPPKGKVSIPIMLLPDKCPNQELTVKAFGYIRIAPMHKYKDNKYSRMDNNYLAPLEINIAARIFRPKVTYSISKYDRTFTFCANAVMKAPHKKMEIRKSYIFYNNEDAAINIIFEITDPFRLTSVITCDSPSECEQLDSVIVSSHDYMQIEVACVVDEDIIEETMVNRKVNRLIRPIHTIKGSFFITHTDRNIQIIDLYLDIQTPLLKLSSRDLNFEEVYVGNTKKMILIIENLSACHQDFKIKKKYANCYFIASPKAGQLMPYPFPGKTVTITISFTPGKTGETGDRLQVITPVSAYKEECIVRGEGTLNRLYLIPDILY